MITWYLVESEKETFHLFSSTTYALKEQGKPQFPPPHTPFPPTLLSPSRVRNC